MIGSCHHPFLRLEEKQDRSTSRTKLLLHWYLSRSNEKTYKGHQRLFSGEVFQNDHKSSWCISNTSPLKKERKKMDAGKKPSHFGGCKPAEINIENVGKIFLPLGSCMLFEPSIWERFVKFSSSPNYNHCVVWQVLKVARFCRRIREPWSKKRRKGRHHLGWNEPSISKYLVWQKFP